MTKTTVEKFSARLGPGLITGAADDDPSGIATYSQAGAQFGFSMVWTLLLTTPLMIGIQMLSARIGWVTGKGLATNINLFCPRWLSVALVALLVVANTINIAADIGAMAEAVRILIGGQHIFYIASFGVLCIAGAVFFNYERIVRVLKWLTLALFAYFAVILTVHVPWARAVQESLLPWMSTHSQLSWSTYAAMVVAVFGTTISPYLFFWQAAQEVEDSKRRKHASALHSDEAFTSKHLSRIKLDTMVGMIFSNLIALCIMLATAITLNLNGVVEIQTATQAAEALRPVAGDFAFALFALGIIGTGLLAVPVLAGSAAYAVGELGRWKTGLSHSFKQAPGFYLIIIAATSLGALMSAFELDPIKALFWSAVVNGVISVPIMVVMMRIGQSTALMGRLTISHRHQILGWLATAVMATAVILMFLTF